MKNLFTLEGSVLSDLFANFEDLVIAGCNEDTIGDRCRLSRIFVTFSLNVFLSTFQLSGRKVRHANDGITGLLEELADGGAHHASSDNDEFRGVFSHNKKAFRLKHRKTDN